MGIYKMNWKEEVKVEDTIKEIEEEYNVKVIKVCETLEEAKGIGRLIITACLPRLLFYAAI